MLFLLRRAGVEAIERCLSIEAWCFTVVFCSVFYDCVIIIRHVHTVGGHTYRKKNQWSFVDDLASRPKSIIKLLTVVFSFFCSILLAVHWHRPQLGSRVGRAQPGILLLSYYFRYCHSSSIPFCNDMPLRNHANSRFFVVTSQIFQVCI